MKIAKPIVLVIAFIFASCSSIRVTTDYDAATNFKELTTFAFYKKGIDQAAISDLDKRRILRAVEAEMLAKGFTKSKNPDILVSIFTKSRKKVNVRATQSMRYDYFNPWYPSYYGRDRVLVSRQIEGTLFLDFIDAKSKKLVWQGVGSGALIMRNVEKREEKIKTFVKDILENYPPEKKK